MLTELSQQHIKETFSTFLLTITCFHSAKPLFPCQKVPFSNLILIMALSLLWFQLLQPLRRFFFWPKIYKNTLLTLSLWKLITETNKQKKEKYTIFSKASGSLLALFLFHQSISIFLAHGSLSPVLLLYTGGQYSATRSSKLWFRGFERLSRTYFTRTLWLVSFSQLGLKSKKNKGPFYLRQHSDFLRNAKEITQLYKNKKIHAWKWGRDSL